MSIVYIIKAFAYDHLEICNLIELFELFDDVEIETLEFMHLKKVDSLTGFISVSAFEFGAAI